VLPLQTALLIHKKAITHSRMQVPLVHQPVSPPHPLPPSSCLPTGTSILSTALLSACPVPGSLQSPLKSHCCCLRSMQPPADARTPQLSLHRALVSTERQWWPYTCTPPASGEGLGARSAACVAGVRTCHVAGPVGRPCAPPGLPRGTQGENKPFLSKKKFFSQKI
jgi:hypothetical protein